MTHKTHLRKVNSFTNRPCPPVRHVHFPGHTPLRCPLVPHPVHGSESPRTVILVTACFCNTHSELCVEDFLDPGYHGLVYVGGVRSIDMIDSHLQVYGPVRVERVWTKQDSLTDHFRPLQTTRAGDADSDDLSPSENLTTEKNMTGVIHTCVTPTVASEHLIRSK